MDFKSGFKLFVLFLFLFHDVRDVEARCRRRKSWYVCNNYWNLEFMFTRRVRRVESVRLSGTLLYIKFIRAEQYPNVKEIEIVKNPRLKTVDLISLPLRLETLNLGQNKITKLKNTERLKTSTHLKKLDISDNDLRHFRFSNLPASVSQLSLRRNRLVGVNMRALLRQMFETNQFTKLDIRGNSFACDSSRTDARILKTLDRSNLNCEYVGNFVCHWLQSNEFNYGELSDDFKFIADKTLWDSCTPSG